MYTSTHLKVCCTCSSRRLSASLSSKAKFHSFSATLMWYLEALPKSSPLELFLPICCTTLGVKAHLISWYLSAISSVSTSTNPTFFDSYQLIRSTARVWGKTRLWEQHPNRGISFIPGGKGSIETLPEAKKSIIHNGTHAAKLNAIIQLEIRHFRGGYKWRSPARHRAGVTTQVIDQKKYLGHSSVFQPKNSSV